MATKKSDAKTSAVPKVRILLKSFDHTVIDEACKVIVFTAEQSGAIVAGPVPLPVKLKKFTLNRSTFVNKDAREQFEVRTHKRLIDLTETTPKTVESLSSLHLPAGVQVSIKMMSV
ncbi:MAG: 30S ribosomal protein S10 [Candidatus Peregrinibacteria bacterium]